MVTGGMKYGITVLIVLLVFAVLQTTTLCYLEVWGAKPDILLIATISFALYKEKRFGCVVGIIGGLLKDTTSGVPFGLHILSFGGLGLVVGTIGSKLYRESLFTQVILTAGAAIFTSLFYYLLSSIFHAPLPLPESFTLIALPSILYTASISPAIFWILGPLLKKPF